MVIISSQPLFHVQRVTACLSLPALTFGQVFFKEAFRKNLT